MRKTTLSRKIFMIFNYLFLTLTSVICIIPILNLLAISFSSSRAINMGLVSLLPVEFNLDAYIYVAKNSVFLTSMWVSVKRVILGVSVDVVLCVLVAYPLSKDKEQFSKRNWYANFLVITMLIGGGMIPTYMIVRATGLLNSIWALIIPTAVQVYNIILLQNFYRGLPVELEEAAFIDGASVLTTLWKIIIPLSKPALATIVLFISVDHWNAWFDGLIYMNDVSKYPLQSYLQTVVIDQTLVANKSAKEMEQMLNITSRNLNAAQIFVALVPIVLVYPFLQKYFTKGIVLGSVKG